jgi:hypothetical protein
MTGNQAIKGGERKVVGRKMQWNERVGTDEGDEGMLWREGMWLTKEGWQTKAAKEVRNNSKKRMAKRRKAAKDKCERKQTNRGRKEMEGGQERKRVRITATENVSGYCRSNAGEQHTREQHCTQVAVEQLFYTSCCTKRHVSLR